MDAVRNASASIEAVNQLLRATNEKVLDAVEKHLKVAVELAVGAEAGKGQNIDIAA